MPGACPVTCVKNPYSFSYLFFFTFWENLGNTVLLPCTSCLGNANYRAGESYSRAALKFVFPLKAFFLFSSHLPPLFCSQHNFCNHAPTSPQNGRSCSCTETPRKWSKHPPPVDTHVLCLLMLVLQSMLIAFVSVSVAKWSSLLLINS